MNIRKRVTAILIAMVVLITYMPVNHVFADDLVLDCDRDYIYVGETCSLMSTNKTVNWKVQDINEEGEVSEKASNVTFTSTPSTLKVSAIKEGKILITATPQNPLDGEAVSHPIEIRPNNFFSFVRVDSSSSETSVADTVDLGGKLQIRTNQRGSDGKYTAIDWTPSGYLEIANFMTDISADQVYTFTGKNTTISDNPVVLSSTYEYTDPEDGKVHIVTIKRNFQVIDTLSLSEKQFTMSKGIPDKPSTHTLTVTASNKANPVTWTVYGPNGAKNPAGFNINPTGSSPNGSTANISLTSELVIANENKDEDRHFTIVATQTVDGRIITTKCTVIVLQPVTGLTLSKDNIILYLEGNGVVSTKDRQSIFARLLGDGAINADFNEISWTSSDESVVDFLVDTEDKTLSSQTIVAKSAGYAFITASAVSDPSQVASAYVEVRPKVTEVKITQEDMTVNLSEEYIQLFSSCTSQAVLDGLAPIESMNTKVRWKSSNEALATVDENTGKVHLLGAGKVTITCVSTDDTKVADTVVITINVPVASVVLDRYAITMNVGESVQATYTLISSVVGQKPSNEEVTWETSDSKVAVVDNEGRITGIAGGLATIIVRADGGDITATCEVTVLQSVQRIDISQTTMSLNVGEEGVLEASVYPSTASKQTVSWSSDNSSVVSVTQDGVVRAKKVGDPVVITAKIVDGERTITKTCIVYVEVPVRAIFLSPPSKMMRKGDTCKFVKTIYPSSATNAHVTFASTNTNVAKVDASGLVTAVGGGSCFITATTMNSNLVTSAYIVVNEKVSSVKLNKKSITLKRKAKYKLKATVLRPSASDKSIQWKSSNKKVATVSSNGTVKAVGYGTATITCKALDGSNKKATCKVYIKKYVTSIKLNTKSKTIKKGKTYTLKAKINPSSATIKKVSWSSSNKNIATISSKGVVKAKKKGRCTITCRALDGSGKKVKCTIKVK